MRNLEKDLQWLTCRQKAKDLSDQYLEGIGETTRGEYESRAPDFDYGITFVESTIALEWLERAIRAEAIQKEIE